ncbi:hypothetical protein BN131_200 [Cronobacter malonaticus 681]|nr:hypothetical protein BN131_200 [Cronobacter malonaticus 681]
MGGVFTAVTVPITVTMIAAVAVAVTIAIPVAGICQRRCGAHRKGCQQKRQRIKTFSFHNPSSFRRCSVISAQRQQKSMALIPGFQTSERVSQNRNVGLPAPV